MLKIAHTKPVIERDEDNDMYSFEKRFSVLRIAVKKLLYYHLRDENNRLGNAKAK